MSDESTTPAPTPGATVRAVLASSRPISWINTAYPFAAAYLLAGGGITPLLIVGTLYFLVPYNVLMYGLNDVFDYESDLRNPRKGGVEGIILDRRLHRATIVSALGSNVPFLVAIVALILTGPLDGTQMGLALAAFAITVGAVVAYSAPKLRFKERPVLDSLTSSTHFVGPAVIGLLCTGHAVEAPAIFALVAFFLWGVASHAFGAVQDITADREGGIGSIATVFGARATVRLSIAAYLAAALLLLGTGWPGSLSAIFPLLYVANIVPFASLTDDECERGNAGWRRFLWLNPVTGFFITQLFIWIVLIR